ncbi:MAG TPA: YqgE/AlgH family protein, partial [Bdellovibrionota bacterium]|nr:YqgE/AlgH family protein [Bdellovibrionota bacterium]
MTSAEEKRCCFLIAMPQLQDPNFFQTTTLLSAFTKDGAMGVILNRPLNVSVKEILGDSSPLKVESTLKVYWGGPVENQRGWIVHEDTAMAAQSMELEAGLYLSSSTEVWKKMIESGKNPGGPRYRFFLGYSGWGPGQLEREIAGSSWVTAPLSRDLIFDGTPHTLWVR